jgi:polyferredoxin
MDKVGAARGLIRYSTGNAMKDGLSAQQVRRRILRPRVLIYIGILSLGVMLYIAALVTRVPLKLDVIRDRGTMGREVEEGGIENVYRLQIMNTDERPHSYRITVSGIDSIALAQSADVALEGATSRTLPMRVRLDHGKGESGPNKIRFELVAHDDERLRVAEQAVFFVPLKR